MVQPLKRRCRVMVPAQGVCPGREDVPGIHCRVVGPAETNVAEVLEPFQHPAC